MRPEPRELLNTPAIELWPAPLLRARAGEQQRQLSTARWLLRDKRSGNYLATLHDGDPHWLVPLGPALSVGHRNLAGALSALGLQLPGAQFVTRPRALASAVRARRAGTADHLPLEGLRQRLDELGLDANDYAARHRLALVPEPHRLAFAGRDRFRRPLWLLHGAATAWRRLQRAAAADGILLDAISGYRSHDYQLGIFRRKRQRGQEVEQILAINAAPGFSEHHSGRALDIGTPGEPPAEESFEGSDAFAWLTSNAADHGFRLSYPRDNPHGIVHEPWHWYWIGPSPPST